MKNTLKTLLAVAALGTASVASAVSIPSAGTVEISRTGFDGGLYGGEFEATITSVQGVDPFITFCIEELQNTPNSAPYEYALSLVGNDSGRTLSAGSAFLFKKFALGQLAEYDTSSTSVHYESAGFFQAALWVLEGYNYVGSYSVNNPFLDLISTDFAGGFAAAVLDYTGTEVKVMNLTPNGLDASRGTLPQDVLVYVPDSGATLALLGFGLAALAIIRRRR